MTKYEVVCRKVDYFYMEIEADSIEQAQAHTHDAFAIAFNSQTLPKNRREKRGLFTKKYDTHLDVLEHDTAKIEEKN